MPCSICQSPFDPAEGNYYEWGLTCRACHVAVQSTPAFTNPGGSAAAGDVATTVAVNAVGIGLLALTGVGFTYGGGGQDEPQPIPDHQRLRMAMPAIRARLAEEQAAWRRRNEILLRRDGEVRGPFTMEQLAQLWEEGHVGPNDEYHYEGMPDFLPVSQFKPPQ